MKQDQKYVCQLDKRKGMEGEEKGRMWWHINTICYKICNHDTVVQRHNKYLEMWKNSAMNTLNTK